MAVGIKAGGFGPSMGNSFKVIQPPAKKGPSGIAPGGFGNFGNTNFHGGPVQQPSLTPQQVKYINAGMRPAAAPATTAPPNFPSPYDATYFVQLAQAQNAANQRIAGYQRSIANEQTALGNNLNTLKFNQGVANTNAQNAENARGGFAQGALGQQLGNIAHQYQTTASADTLKFQQDQANWNAAISAVQQGMPLEQIALGLASAGRQAALGLQAPGTAPNATPAPKAATTAPTVPRLPTTPKAKLPKKGQKAGIAAGGLTY